MKEAEKIAEGTATQESPTEKINQTESESSDTAEKLDKTPEKQEEVAPEEPASEKNWRALREENEHLKEQLKSQTPTEENPLQSAVKSELGIFLSQDDKTEIRLQELRAEEAFPELETDPIFQKVAEGAYLKALAEYNSAIMQGKQASLPNAYKIVKGVKKEFDARFGEVSKKAEVEGAKKAQVAKEAKMATTEAEGRSDRVKQAASSEEIAELREKSRYGGNQGLEAITERLQRSSL